MTVPPGPDARRRRARRLGIVLGTLGLGLAVAGGGLFLRSQIAERNDPGHSVRTPVMLDQMLARAERAEQVGDSATAITSYRFVLAVGSNGDPAIEPYIAAARRGLERLGVRP